MKYASKTADNLSLLLGNNGRPYFVEDREGLDIAALWPVDESVPEGRRWTGDWELVNGQCCKVTEEIPPPPPPDPSFVPQIVSNAQFRAALILAGIDPGDPGTEADPVPGSVLYALHQIENPTQRRLAVNKWVNANTIERPHSLVIAFADVFQLTTEQVDELFRVAATQ